MIAPPFTHAHYARRITRQYSQHNVRTRITLRRDGDIAPYRHYTRNNRTQYSNAAITPVIFARNNHTRGVHAHYPAARWTPAGAPGSRPTAVTPRNIRTPTLRPEIIARALRTHYPRHCPWRRATATSCLCASIHPAQKLFVPLCVHNSSAAARALPVGVPHRTWRLAIARGGSPPPRHAAPKNRRSPKRNRLLLYLLSEE